MAKLKLKIAPSKPIVVKDGKLSDEAAAKIRAAANRMLGGKGK